MATEHLLIGTDAGLFDLDGEVTFAEREVLHLVDGWAVVDGAPHRRERDGWQADPVQADVEVTCVAALDDGEALAGTAGAHLVRVVDDRVVPVRGFDEAPSRGQWYTPWGGPPDVRSIAIDGDGTWFVNVHVGGILRSGGDDGWADTIDLDTDVHQVLTGNDGVVLAALGLGGMALSRDGGRNWSFHEEGLHATYCRAVALAGDTILLSASGGPGGMEAAVYRRPLAQDGPFDRCVDGLPDRFDDNVDTHCLDAAGHTAVIGTASGEVYSSEDAGRSWTEVATGLPPVRCVHLGGAVRR